MKQRFEAVNAGSRAAAVGVASVALCALSPLSAAPSFAIHGGQPVNQQVTPTPWFGELSITMTNGDEFSCGATVIGSQWLLTAAHCVTDEGMRARPKASYVQLNPPRSGKGEKFRWDRVVVHPGYDPDKLGDDIAVIHTDRVLPAPSLPFGGPQDDPPTGSALRTVGFGATDRSDHSDQLLAADVTDMDGPQSKCKEYGKDYRPAVMICAGTADGAQDAGEGDSGGPLTTVGNEPMQVGVVSWGSEEVDRPHDRHDYPGIYARVSMYSAWITQQTGIPSAPKPNPQPVDSQLVNPPPSPSPDSPTLRTLIGWLTGIWIGDDASGAEQ